MYADDVVLIAPSAGALHNLLNICQKFSEEMDLVFNDKKTVCMCIAKANSGSSMPSFRLGEKSLDIVNEVKYLGHVIRSDFTDDKDIASQLRGLYCRANMLVKRFSKCSDYIKCMLFKTYCSSMYCCA